MKPAKKWSIRAGISFVSMDKQQNVLANLEPRILFLLSLDTAIVLASDNKFLGIAVTDVVLESVIERSWRAIQK